MSEIKASEIRGVFPRENHQVIKNIFEGGKVSNNAHYFDFENERNKEIFSSIPPEFYVNFQLILDYFNFNEFYIPALKDKNKMKELSVIPLHFKDDAFYLDCNFFQKSNALQTYEFKRKIYRKKRVEYKNGKTYIFLMFVKQSIFGFFIFDYIEDEKSPENEQIKWKIRLVHDTRKNFNFVNLSQELTFYKQQRESKFHKDFFIPPLYFFKCPKCGKSSRKLYLRYNNGKDGFLCNVCSKLKNKISYSGKLAGFLSDNLLADGEVCEILEKMAKSKEKVSDVILRKMLLKTIHKNRKRKYETEPIKCKVIELSQLQRKTQLPGTNKGAFVYRMNTSSLQY